MNKLFFTALVSTSILLTNSIFTSTVALAHHPLNGATPSTFNEGLLSGIFHPIIGLDHLAFVVAVGVVAVLLGSRFLLPLAFVVATLGGTALHLYSVSLIGVELFIGLSLLTLGLIISLAKQYSFEIFHNGLYPFFGLFHGFAYGEAIFGAESTPLVAYLFGFGVIQYLLSVAAGVVIVATFGKSASWRMNLPARLVGAMVLGAGVLLVGEHIIEFAIL